VPAELEPSAGEVLAGIVQPPGHRVAGVAGPLGYGIACECGGWQALVTGLSSARWAGLDYRRHAAEVEAAARGARSEEHTLSAVQVARRMDEPPALALSCSCKGWFSIAESDAALEQLTDRWMEHAGARP